ncbi:MAG: hypothetical protein MUP67_07025 [Acidimicrobiia bacterium]|nr:hypothetical protein [Acidimicrobiia bacterium]
MSTNASGASSPTNRRTHVHHGQVSRAFKQEAGAYLARLVAHEDSGALLERVPDGPAVALEIARPEEFAAVLDRDDLTLLDGAPLVLVGPAYGVVGVATGPATPPAHLSVVFVSRLEGGHAVEIPASDPDQPSWQLFAVEFLQAPADG